MSIENKLEEESVRLLSELAKLDPSTEEYKFVLNEWSQLTGRDIEYKKLALDTTEKTRANELANRKVNLEVADKTEGRLIERDKLNYEERKLEAETKNSQIVRDQEAKVKKVQMRDERINNIAKHVVTVLLYGTGLTASIALTKAAFVYEENGAIVSPWGKKIIGMFLPDWKPNKY